MFLLFRGAAYLGLCSSVFASLALAGYIYVYVRTERQRQQPHLPAIVVFAVIGAVGISVGVGTVVIFLGLGIVDSVNHVGTYCISSFHTCFKFQYIFFLSDLPLTHTHYIASVWAFATFKWGLIVFIHALRTFRKMVRNQFSPLQQEARDDGAALITGEEATSGTINS